MNLRKFFLYLLIASVALSAVLGIVVILAGNFGEFETKILLTTLTITVTSILGLASGAFLETGRGRILPIAGIICAVISAGMWIALLWGGEWKNDVLVKFLMSVTLLATSCSLLSLLSIARLDRRFIWTNYAAHGAVWTMTAFLFYLIWIEKDFTGDFIPRTLGVLSIVIAALTVVTPVFHKLSAPVKAEAGRDEIDAEIEKLETRIAELKAQRESLDENED